MPTRNIVLTEHQDALVGQLVESGRYQSASEVLRDSLRLLEDRLERQMAELEDIRAGVIEGLEQARRGEFIEGAPEEIVRGAFTEARAKRGL